VAANGEFFMNKLYLLALSLCAINFFAYARIPQDDDLKSALENRLHACFFDGLNTQECEKQIFKPSEQLTYDTAKEVRMELGKIKEKSCDTPTPTDECVFMKEMYKVARNKEQTIKKELLKQHKASRKLL
jgi:hypothetical protein